MFHVVQALYNYEMHALKEENKKSRPARNNLYLKTTRRFIFMYIHIKAEEIQFLLFLIALWVNNIQLVISSAVWNFRLIMAFSFLFRSMRNTYFYLYFLYIKYFSIKLFMFIVCFLLRQCTIKKFYFYADWSHLKKV
jgi:hypothetical protein